MILIGGASERQLDGVGAFQEYLQVNFLIVLTNTAELYNLYIDVLLIIFDRVRSTNVSPHDYYIFYENDFGKIWYSNLCYSCQVESCRMHVKYAAQPNSIEQIPFVVEKVCRFTFPFTDLCHSIKCLKRIIPSASYNEHKPFIQRLQGRNFSRCLMVYYLSCSVLTDVLCSFHRQRERRYLDDPELVILVCPLIWSLVRLFL